MRASVAKTAGRRVVPITPAWSAWLVPLARPVGKLTPTAQVYQDRLETARTDADIERWPANCLRHSAASYWLAKEQDLSRVSLWLGHAPAILQSDYRTLVTPAATAEWFSVVPSKKRRKKKKKTGKSNSPAFCSPLAHFEAENRLRRYASRGALTLAERDHALQELDRLQRTGSIVLVKADTRALATEARRLLAPFSRCPERRETEQPTADQNRSLVRAF